MSDLAEQIEAIREANREVQRRNARALFVLENEWGNGRINISELRAILRGDNERN